MNAWFESVFGLWFVDPWLVLLGVAAIVVGALWRGRARSVRVAAFGDLAHDGDGRSLPVGVRVYLARALGPMRVLGLLSLALACGRPVERVPQPLSTRGIDAVLCLDVSSSMGARDLGDARSRLDVAVAAAADFARSREGDRLALVRFARFSRLLSPPTTDALAIVDALERLEPVEADGDEDATGIGLALARSTELLDAGGSAARVVVLLTDGLENVALGGADGVTPRAATRLAARRGVRVYTVLVSPGPVDDAVDDADDAGDGSSATADAIGELRRLAEHTGGRLFEARDASEVGEAWSAIDALERVELSVPRFVHRERFSAFVLVGLALLGGVAAARRLGLEVLP